MKDDRYNINDYFSNLETINPDSIKSFYLSALGHIKSDAWSNIYKKMSQDLEKQHASNIHFVTSDAYTLSGGPSIFMANDVQKVAKFCLQDAKIPSTVMESIRRRIHANNRNSETIIQLQMKYEEGTMNVKDRKLRDGRVDPEMKRLLDQIQKLNTKFVSVTLDEMFIPNSQRHLERFHPDIDKSKDIPFTSTISETVVDNIMKVDDVPELYKLLLLMGIGVFKADLSIKYTEIMKELAQNQKLFMIIASSDYIYGTNYQFSWIYWKRFTRNNA